MRKVKVDAVIEPKKFKTAVDALSFMQAGNATFTLRSVQTGVRFTYRARESDDGKVFFIGVLNGPDNETSYAYLGIIRNGMFRRTEKSRVSEDAMSHKAFAWSYAQLSRGQMPKGLEVWHEARCGRCGKKLTVPESIELGIGPECAGKMGKSWPSSPELTDMGTHEGRAKYKSDVATYNNAVKGTRKRRTKPVDTGSPLPDDGVNDLFRE